MANGYQYFVPMVLENIYAQAYSPGRDSGRKGSINNMVNNEGSEG